MFDKLKVYFFWLKVAKYPYSYTAGDFAEIFEPADCIRKNFPRKKDNQGSPVFVMIFVVDLCDIINAKRQNKDKEEKTKKRWGNIFT